MGVNPSFSDPYVKWSKLGWFGYVGDGHQSMNRDISNPIGYRIPLLGWMTYDIWHISYFDHGKYDACIFWSAADSPRSTWLMNPLDEFWRKKRGIKRDENIMKIKISSWWGWCFSQCFSCQAPYHMTASYEELENNFCFVGSGKGCWGWLLMSTLKSVSQLFRLLTLRFHLFICLNIYPIFCSSATHHPWILAFRIISFKNMDRTPTCETQRWPRKRYNWEHLAFLWGSSALFHGEMGWKAIQKPCGISAQ